MYKNDFRQQAEGVKMVFYAVAIQRLCQKAFFMQPPYSGSYIYAFLYRRYAAEARNIHFSCRRQTAKATKTNLAAPKGEAQGTKTLFCSYYHKTKE